MLLDPMSIAPEAVIVEPARRVIPSIPSLLGRDVLAHFALFVEERSDRVLPLDAQEAHALPLP
jgi:hypothetical protein